MKEMIYIIGKESSFLSLCMESLGKEGLHSKYLDSEALPMDALLIIVDGEEYLNSIRIEKKLPIILLSENLEIEQQILSLVDSVVFKPAELRSFLKLVEAWQELLAESPLDEEYVSEGNIVELQMQIIRQYLIQGDFSSAETILIKIENIFQQFPSKTTEQNQISDWIEKISEIVRNQIGLVENISKTNFAEALVFENFKQNKIKNIVAAQLKKQSRFKITRQLNQEDFLEAKNENVEPESFEFEAQSDSKFIPAPILDKSSVFQSQREETTEKPPKIQVRSGDIPFVQKMIEERLITKSQLLKSLEQQKRLAAWGDIQPLCEIMLADGTVFLDSLKSMGGIVPLVYCYYCEKAFRIWSPEDLPPENFSCYKCQQSLDFPPSHVLAERKQKEEERNEIALGYEAKQANMRRMLRRAMSLARQKKYHEALLWFQKILQIDPENEECLTARIQIYLGNGEYQIAIQEATALLDRNPHNDKARCQRGIAEYYTQDLEESISDMSILIDKKVCLFLANSTRGKAHFHLRLYTEAIEDLSKAIALSPHFVKGYIYRGKAHLYNKRIDMAIQDFEEALRVNPYIPQAKEIKRLIEIAQSRK